MEHYEDTKIKGVSTYQPLVEKHEYQISSSNKEFRIYLEGLFKYYSIENLQKMEDFITISNNQNKESNANTITYLREENNQLKQMLNEKYKTKTVFLSSVCFFFAMSGAIYLYFVDHVVIVTPVISIPLFIVSLGFIILSLWRGF